MGAYKFWIGFKKQLGLLIEYNNCSKELIINILIIKIICNFNKESRGYKIFKKEM